MCCMLHGGRSGGGLDLKLRVDSRETNTRSPSKNICGCTNLSY